MDIIGYSLTVDNGDGSSSTHFYKTFEAAQAHNNWELKEFGYYSGEPEPVRMSDFKDSFEKPW